jgi:hypothetical protein
MVESRLGRNVIVPEPQATLRVRGRVERRDAGGFRATLSLRDGEGRPLGTRRVSSESAHCAALDDTLAVVLSLMLDLRGAGLTIRAEPPDPRETSETRGSGAGAETEAKRRWEATMMLGAVAGLGLVPGAGIGGRASVGLEPPGPWSVELEGSLWAPTETGDDHRKGEFLLRYGALSTCLAPVRRDRWRLALCAGVGAGAVRGRGLGLDEPRADEGALAMTMGRLRVGTRLIGPVWLRAGAVAVIPFVRDRFTVQGADGTRTTLHEPAAAAGLLELGLAVRIR